MQKLDIALYDKDFKSHTISDVIISDTQEITKVDTTGFDMPVEVIYINDQDHAYGKFSFDSRSI